MPNLLKYALGLNPMVAPASGLPVIGLATVEGTDFVTFTYTKIDSATDIDYIPEWSSDLMNWSNDGLTEVVLSDNGKIQVVQDSIPVSGEAIFVHLRVTRP